MADALDKLRRHEDLTDEERAALDFQIIAGTRTRAAVSSLLIAILQERVEGFHGDAGDWLDAARVLMACLLRAAREEGLIDYRKEAAGYRAAQSLYSPSKLLLLWGDTRQGLETKRRRKAMERYDQQHPPQDIAA